MWECKPLWLRRWSRPERADIRSALTVLAAVVPGRHALLIGRALMGISPRALPTVAMAYVSKVMHPKSIGWAPWADG